MTKSNVSESQNPAKVNHAAKAFLDTIIEATKPIREYINAKKPTKEKGRENC